uniref:Homeobox domain-containing protein n=1 Tax=Schistosoma curassoni TaxID=6186 RepID=A0A183KZC9_9TREM
LLNDSYDQCSHYQVNNNSNNSRIQSHVKISSPLISIPSLTKGVSSTSSTSVWYPSCLGIVNSSEPSFVPTSSELHDSSVMNECSSYLQTMDANYHPLLKDTPRSTSLYLNPNLPTSSSSVMHPSNLVLQNVHDSPSHGDSSCNSNTSIVSTPVPATVNTTSPVINNNSDSASQLSLHTDNPSQSIPPFCHNSQQNSKLHLVYNQPHSSFGSPVVCSLSESSSLNLCGNMLNTTTKSTSNPSNSCLPFNFDKNNSSFLNDNGINNHLYSLTSSIHDSQYHQNIRQQIKAPLIVPPSLLPSLPSLSNHPYPQLTNEHLMNTTTSHTQMMMNSTSINQSNPTDFIETESIKTERGESEGGGSSESEVSGDYGGVRTSDNLRSANNHNSNNNNTYSTASNTNNGSFELINNELLTNKKYDCNIDEIPDDDYLTGDDTDGDDCTDSTVDDEEDTDYDEVDEYDDDDDDTENDIDDPDRDFDDEDREDDELSGGGCGVTSIGGAGGRDILEISE